MYLPTLVLVAAAIANAQTGSGGWSKSYPVSEKASLTLSTGDASVEVSSCGSCREVKVGIDWRGRRPSDFDLNESQSGDHVNFELKEKTYMGVHFKVGSWHNPRITVETPSRLDIEARTEDGSLKVSGVQGSLELHTGDGAVNVEDVAGSMRLTASDGNIKIHNVTGTLETRSSDGHATIDGRFTALQAHTSDGNLDVTLSEGTHLTSSSRIESSDGQVTVKLPRTLAADLDIHTGDGQIRSTLPLTMEGYDSSHTSGHNLRGHLNAGGVPLTIHTSDGNVTISAL
ncbi:MAG: DUF4097 family beta strand repeat-containing protein [Terracidiphilus sp.]